MGKLTTFTYVQNTTSPLSPLTSMLLSNLTSHPSLLPQIAHLIIPIIPLPETKHYPPYFFPAAASASSTVHRDFRDPAFSRPNAEAGQEEERDIEGLRALVQAFEDGAAEGVKEGKGKRKGECHFLASVFANVSMVTFLIGLDLMSTEPSQSYRPPALCSSLRNHLSLDQLRQRRQILTSHYS